MRAVLAATRRRHPAHPAVQRRGPSLVQSVGRRTGRHLRARHVHGVGPASRGRWRHRNRDGRPGQRPAPQHPSRRRQRVDDLHLRCRHAGPHADGGGRCITGRSQAPLCPSPSSSARDAIRCSAVGCRTTSKSCWEQGLFDASRREGAGRQPPDEWRLHRLRPRSHRRRSRLGQPQRLRSPGLRESRDRRSGGARARHAGAGPHRRRRVGRTPPPGQVERARATSGRPGTSPARTSAPR